ncbi:hypothetical protein D3C86_1333720 [compost metagenome]
MSCGSAGPSTIISPLFTTWPSCTSTCFSLAIRNSWALPSRSVITRRCLPLVSLPNDVVPVTSASTAASFGERASNSSATRGRPPVMSRVFCDSVGIRASTSPTCTCWPSFTVISAPTWKPMVTEWSVPGILTSWPFASSSFTCGRRPLVAAVRRLASITTRVDRPVTSSICLATVTPSSTFSNFVMPVYSDTIGRVSASHVASCVPALMAWPSCTSSVAPYGILWRSRSRPWSSVISVSPEREITISSPLAFVT